MTLGEQIKQLRITKGLTQWQLGNLINLAESTISLYESNKRSPDYETLKKIADFFSVSTDFLLGREDNLDKVKEQETSYKVKNASDNIEQCIDFEELFKQSNVYFEGVLLDNKDKEDIIQFLKAAWKFRINKE